MIIYELLVRAARIFSYNIKGDVMREHLYDRNLALLYAQRWAMGRNPRYDNFDGIGGDCTNFVSQCIFAGAMAMNFDYPFGWYYKSQWDRSPSWAGVEFLYRFLTGNDGVGPYGQETSLQMLRTGDVIQLGDGNHFYHSLLVIRTEPEIMIAAHTDDTYNRPLSSYNYTVARGIHIEGVRIA